MKTKIIIILIAIPIFAFFIYEAIFSLRYFTNRRIPDKFILPDNYQGWVIVEWQRPNCPPLKQDEEFRVHVVNKNGITCTKSKPQSGWATNWYQYKSSPHTNLMQNPKSNLNHIWHEDHILIKNTPVDIFYVGKYKLDEKKLEEESKKLGLILEQKQIEYDI